MVENVLLNSNININCSTSLGMMEIHNNNLVECWHNILKNTYPKDARRQRPGTLVFDLVEEAHHEMGSKIVLSLNGFIRRRTNRAGEKQLDESDTILDKIAFNIISRIPRCEESDLLLL